MDIINKTVTHKLWGCGTILNIDGTIVEVSFDEGIKKMQFPEAFDKFLKFDDVKCQEYAEGLITEKIEKAKAEQEQKRIEQERMLQQRIIREQPRKKNSKPVEKANIAFKCTYCNGGCSDTCIGFKGACSDDIIDYNIEVANHTWCTSDDAPCLAYYNGEISREELDEHCIDGGFVCYECIMLSQWKAHAGFYLHGENEGKPMKLKKVQINSLALLTTRYPDSMEKDRFVFGVFLVDEAYEGDNQDEGYVTTDSKYKIELTPKEAMQIKYWNYYYNANAKDNISWGHGLHRYIDDIQAAQILRDIVKLKENTKDAELSKEFFEHFCKVNGLDADDIPEPNGALINL